MTSRSECVDERMRERERVVFWNVSQSKWGKNEERERRRGRRRLKRRGDCLMADSPMEERERERSLMD